MPFLELIGPLQSKASRLADVELEVKQLRDTLAEYNEEFRQVRNQGKTSLKNNNSIPAYDFLFYSFHFNFDVLLTMSKCSRRPSPIIILVVVVSSTVRDCVLCARYCA